MATKTSSSASSSSDATSPKPTKRRAAAAQTKEISTSRSFAILFTLTGLGALWVVLPYWVPLFLGATFAATLAPLKTRIERRFGMRHTLAAGSTVVLLWGVIITPFLSLFAYGANEVVQGLEWTREAMQMESLRAMYAGRLPAVVRSLVERALGGLQIGPEELEKIGKGFVEVAQKATPTVFGASIGLVGTLLMVLLSCFFFLVDGPKLIATIIDDVPLPHMHLRELLDEFRAVATASLMGMAFTALGQCVALTIGFWAAGLPHLFFFAVMSLIGAFVPLVGSTVIWLPTAIGLALAGRTGAGLGVAVWSILSVQIIDTLLKPMVLQGKMTLHGALTFLGMLGGLNVFGPVGVIAGPMVLALFCTFVRLYERDYVSAKGR